MSTACASRAGAPVWPSSTSAAAVPVAHLRLQRVELVRLDIRRVGTTRSNGPSTPSSRSARTKAISSRCARAFSRASSSAASEASVAATRAPRALVGDREGDRAAAGTDVEHARGFLIPDQREAALDDDLRLGPRHQGARVGAERQAAEVPVAEHAARSGSRAPRRCTSSRAAARSASLQRPVVLRIELDAREAERSCEQALGIEARALHAASYQVVGRGGEHLAERHRSKRATLLVSRQRVGEVVERPAENLLERHVQLDAVVGDAALGEVVGPGIFSARAPVPTCALRAAACSAA